MDRRQELVDKDEERWVLFHGLIDSLTPEQMLEPTLNEEGWSVKDMIWHLGCWAADGARVLEQMNMGTYVPREYDTDAENARYLEEGRTVDIETARSEWSSARTRMLQEWGALETITPEAEEYFYEEGPEHIDEHLPELRRFVENLG